MEEGRKVSHMCLLLLLAVLQTTTASAENSSSPPALSPAAYSFLTRPADLTVAAGQPAEFHCAVPQTSPNFTFTFYGSHGNYVLWCPWGHMEDIPQALYGSCEVKDGESSAVWTLKGASFSDNGTRVVCQQSRNPNWPVAVLYVYDNGVSQAVLIGCAIGGFFGVLLVFGLLYLMLQRSETLQRCFRGKETPDDLTTIVSKE